MLRGLLLFTFGVLLITGCGRSPLPGASTDATVDQEVVKDQTIPVEFDSRTQPIDLAPPPLDGICLPGCTARCKLVTGCGLFPQGPAQCLTECPNWSDPIKACLDGLICAQSNDCQAALACIKAPPLPDLLVKDFAASANGNTVTYKILVCNGGKATAGPFSVGLYYDQKQPPKPMQKPDQLLPVAGGLQLGDCAPLVAQRKNTPPGSYSSWVQADVEGKVAEIDESNNLAGPLSVTSSGPLLPDLVIQQLTVTKSGADLVYDLKICNIGTVHAWLVRTDIYYNRLLKPTNLIIGDQNVTFLTGLAPKTCKNATRTYKNVPVGMYRSWAQVDALNTVKESNEANNVTGPKLTTVSPQSGCVSLCTFAISCGLFKITEFSQCLTWCNLMSKTQRACADAADKQGSCAALKQCSLPAKPPAPPPPWACLNICSYLVNTCKVLPANQQLTCIGGCITLPKSKQQCALNAMAKKQCAAMALCIL